MLRRYSVHCTDVANHAADCDCAWIAGRLKICPPGLSKTITTRYQVILDKDGRTAANKFLLELTDPSTSHALKPSPTMQWVEISVEEVWKDGEPVLIKKRIVTDIDLSSYMHHIAGLYDDEVRDLAKTIASADHFWDFVSAYSGAT